MRLLRWLVPLAVLVAVLTGGGGASAQHASVLHRLMVKLTSHAADHTAGNLVDLHDLSSKLIEESVKAITGEAAGRTATHLSDVTEKVSHEKAYKLAMERLSLGWARPITFPYVTLISGVIKRASTAAKMREQGVPLSQVIDSKVDVNADRDLILAYRARVKAYGQVLADPDGSWYGPAEAYGLRMLLQSFQTLVATPVQVPIGLDHGISYLSQHAAYAALHPELSRFCSAMSIAFRTWLVQAHTSTFMYDVHAATLRRYIDGASRNRKEKKTAAYAMATKLLERVPAIGQEPLAYQVHLMESPPVTETLVFPQAQNIVANLLDSAYGPDLPAVESYGEQATLSPAMYAALHDPTLSEVPLHLRRPHADYTPVVSDSTIDRIVSENTPPTTTATTAAHTHRDPTSGHVE